MSFATASFYITRSVHCLAILLTVLFLFPGVMLPVAH